MIDALVEALFLLAIVSGVVVAVTGKDSEAWPMVAVFTVMFLLEKLITVYHASHYVREYLPVDKQLDIRSH